MTPSAIEPVSADPPPLPGRRVLRQRWTDLAYFHWPYDPAVVRPLLPDGVRVDTYDGAAWIGVVPFVMRDVRVGPTPPIPWLGTFVEINVRTYVVDELGRRAVWFFSLDVPRAAIVAVARSVFSLPYCWAAAEHHDDGGRHRYLMRRRWPLRGPTAELTYRTGPRIPDDDVDGRDHFLTARWALLARRGRRLRYGAVHHPRWPLHVAEQVEIDEDIVSAAGLPRPAGEPLARCSPGVPVEVAWFRTVPMRDTTTEEA